MLACINPPKYVRPLDRDVGARKFLALAIQRQVFRKSIDKHVCDGALDRRPAFDQMRKNRRLSDTFRAGTASIFKANSNHDTKPRPLAQYVKGLREGCYDGAAQFCEAAPLTGVMPILLYLNLHYRNFALKRPPIFMLIRKGPNRFLHQRRRLNASYCNRHSCKSVRPKFAKTVLSRGR